MLCVIYIFNIGELNKKMNFVSNTLPSLLIFGINVNGGTSSFFGKEQSSILSSVDSEMWVWVEGRVIMLNVIYGLVYYVLQLFHFELLPLIYS